MPQPISPMNGNHVVKGYNSVMIHFALWVSVFLLMSQNCRGQVPTEQHNGQTMNHELIELRIYKLKPGMRQQFIEYLNTFLAPLHQEIGMDIMGQFIDLKDENTFIWMRGFPKAALRDSMRSQLYNGRAWKEKFEALVVPIVDNSNVYLIQPLAVSKIK